MISNTRRATVAGIVSPYWAISWDTWRQSIGRHRSTPAHTSTNTGWTSAIIWPLCRQIHRQSIVRCSSSQPRRIYKSRWPTHRQWTNAKWENKWRSSCDGTCVVTGVYCICSKWCPNCRPAKWCPSPTTHKRVSTPNLWVAVHGPAEYVRWWWTPWRPALPWLSLHLCQCHCCRSSLLSSTKRRRSARPFDALHHRDDVIREETEYRSLLCQRRFDDQFTHLMDWIVLRRPNFDYGRVLCASLALSACAQLRSIGQRLAAHYSITQTIWVYQCNNKIDATQSPSLHMPSNVVLYTQNTHTHITPTHLDLARLIFI